MARGPDIEALVAKWGPKIAKAFLEALALVADRVDMRSLVKMIEQNDIEGAVRAVGLDPVLFGSLETAVADSYQAGGYAAVATIPATRDRTGQKLDILFNARNPEAESWLKERSSSRVVEIIEEQRMAIREVLTKSMAAGINPVNAATQLVGKIGPNGKRQGGLLGLTRAQQSWVDNYTDELESNSKAALTRNLRDKRFDKRIEKAIAEGKPLDLATRLKMVENYKNRVLKYRANVLGRTEAMTSLHKGQHDGYEQAIEAGQVEARYVRKTWQSAGDTRVRDSHADLNGTTVGFKESFRTKRGFYLRFTCDPRGDASEVIQCRCSTLYRIDYLANVR